MDGAVERSKVGRIRKNANSGMCVSGKSLSILASESEANRAVTKAIPFWRGRLAGGVVVFDGAHQGVDVLKGE